MPRDTLRSRSLRDTHRAALLAGRAAGVTRLADVTQLAGMALPMFQAVRPTARSLTVSQGKGATPLAAQVSALLEAHELHLAERLGPEGEPAALDELEEAARHCWSGPRDRLGIDLQPDRKRYWVPGTDLRTEAAMPMPWDLLSLDFTRAPAEYPATSNGLATGGTHCEAVVAALCELLEHDMAARFAELGGGQQLGLQVDLRTIDDPNLVSVLNKVRKAGFAPRLWSMGQEGCIAAIRCVLLPADTAFDRLAPVAGSACHPHRGIAAITAVLEAVQARATLIAGARDDLEPGHYSGGGENALRLVLRSLALGEGGLAWPAVPDSGCRSYPEMLDFLLRRIADLTTLPVVAFGHRCEIEGLSVVHALAPGLRDPTRQQSRSPTDEPRITTACAANRAERRIILFAGPSIAGLPPPSGIDVRPPAICGDLAALLDDPPCIVGLVDGYFAQGPTVWHKEILALLSSGTQVVGAASIGALRAAELEGNGMQGVGWVFEAYRTGAIRRDDAVMLLHAPGELDYRPLTLPLVDAECALLHLALTARDRRTMQRIVRTQAYDRRTWRGCLAVFKQRTGRPFPITLEALEAMPSVKAHDARLLVGRLAGEAWPGAGARRRPAPLLTSYFEHHLTRTAPAYLASLRSGNPHGRAT